MPVLVYCKLIRPRDASHIKTVLLWCHVKFTSERTKRNIGVGNDGLVLKNNIYFFRLVANGFLGWTFYEGDDVSNSSCYGIHAAGEDNTGSWRIDLSPFDRRWISTELLGGCLRKYQDTKRGD